MMISKKTRKYLMLDTWQNKLLFIPRVILYSLVFIGGAVIVLWFWIMNKLLGEE